MVYYDATATVSLCVYVIQYGESIPFLLILHVFMCARVCARAYLCVCECVCTSVCMSVYECCLCILFGGMLCICLPIQVCGVHVCVPLTHVSVSTSRGRCVCVCLWGGVCVGGPGGGGVSVCRCVGGCVCMSAGWAGCGERGCRG